MPALGCNVNTVLALASCFDCLSENQLLQLEVRLREQIYAKSKSTSPRGIRELLVAARDWISLSDHQRHSIEVRELCNDAVLVSARTSCDVDELKQESACYCTSNSNLEAIIALIKCQTRQ